MSKLLPTDSILVYQHNASRMYFATLESNPMTNSGVVCKSPSEAIQNLRPSTSTMSFNWLLVDTLTSDIYPELFV